MSYFTPQGAVTVEQTPIILADGSLGPTPGQPSDAELLANAEVINVTGTAPPRPVVVTPAAKKKAFPWLPVLLGAGALLAVVMVMKKGGAKTGAPAAA